MAPQDPDTRPVFVGREQIIQDIFDYLHGDGRVVLVTGQHLVGKTALLEELERRMRNDDPRLVPGLYALAFHDDIFSPFLEATAKVLDVIGQRHWNDEAEQKTTAFFKGLIDKSGWKKVGVALCRDLGGLVKIGNTAAALANVVREAADAADFDQSIASLIQEHQPVMKGLVDWLEVMVEMVRPEDRLVLCLDQVEYGRKSFRDLMGDLLLNLPDRVCLVMGNNVGTVGGTEFRKVLAPLLAEKRPQEIDLPGLGAAEIGRLVAETKGVKLDQALLNEVTAKSYGWPGFLVPWMESDDFREGKYTSPGNVRNGPYAYYREMMQALDRDPIMVAERMSLLSGPLPDGLEDVGQVFGEDVHWADGRVRALEAGGIFKRFGAEDEAWFAHEFLAAFIRDEWMTSSVREAHARVLREYLERTHKIKLTFNDNLGLFSYEKRK